MFYWYKITIRVQKKVLIYSLFLHIKVNKSKYDFNNILQYEGGRSNFVAWFDDRAPVYFKES